MYRSGSVRPVVGENAPSWVRRIRYPLAKRVEKTSWTTLSWLRVVVLVKRSYERPSRRRSSAITRL